MSQPPTAEQAVCPNGSVNRVTGTTRLPGATVLLTSVATDPGIKFSLANLFIGIVQSPADSCEYDFGGGRLHTPLPRGSCLIAPPGRDLYTRHSTIETLLLILEAGLLGHAAYEATGGRPPEVLPAVAADDPLLAQIGFTLAADLAGGQPGGRLLHESLATAAAAWVARRYAARPAQPPGQDRKLSPAKLRAALVYIEAHLAGDASLDGMARAAGLSPSHFAHLFRRSTGASPRQYLLRRRVEHAQALLRAHPNRTLAWVAVTAGFHDDRHMARYFLRFLGVSPAAFRGG